MSFTITSPVGQRLAEALEPWLTEDLERYLDAIGSMFDPVYELVEEEGTDGDPDFVSAWGKLFDPDLCPAKYLPYLGQFVGVEVPVGMSEAEARALIKEEPMSRRGRTSTIEAAIRRSLTGEKHFTLIERRNANGEEDPDHFLIVVKEAELPSQKALEANVNRVKPWGIFYTVQVKEEWAWDEAEHTWEADTMTWAETATRRP